MKKVAVPANAGRLVNAVASIGYDTEVALCDLMDNSIDAGATKVSVVLSEDAQDSEGQTDLVGSYVIADDGVGMTEDALLNAFTLGSERDYPSGSLGKFGLGLKSAGLSLGNRISIITKTDTESLCSAVLSVSDIVSSGDYRIDLGEPSQHLLDLWHSHAPDEEHGTVLLIDEPTDSQPSYTAFVRYFTRYCSNVYHLFLGRSTPLIIEINGKQITPIDPLFFQEASQNGSLTKPLEWDGKTPHLLLDRQELRLDDDTSCFIGATHLVHPPSFDAEGDAKKARERYQIESDPYTARPRHGFYVYRNDRIIVMAERFHGLISSQTQAWAFRGRLLFDETADDILALDVKKRHMRLPKGARNNLKGIIANYQTKSVDAWKAAGKRVIEWKKLNKDEIANKSISQTPVGDLSYAPGADLGTDEDMLERKEAQERVGNATLESIHDSKVSKESLDRKAAAEDAVVRVDSIKGNAMWLPYPAVTLGRAETVVNKSHSWIAEALALAEDDPRIAMLLYQMFTILSRAELEVRSTKWPGISEDVVNKLLDIFRRKASAIGEDLADSFASELNNISDNIIDGD